jgi:sugar phosphate permease
VGVSVILPSVSLPLSRVLAARGIHYGWVVAAVTFLTMLATAGALGSAGVMLVPLEREFGWSNATISAALALRFAVFGLMGPFAAALMNRFGLRAVMLCAIGLIAAGLAASCLMTRLWQLYLLWGVTVGLGTGMTALVLGATTATRWFSARRGLVVGLLTASNATGQLVFLPLLATVAKAAGWRAALGVVIALLALAWLLALLLMRDHPADLGLPSYGETRLSPPPVARGNLLALAAAPLTALREALATQSFAVLFLSFFICGLSTNGLVQTHWIPLCGDYGVAPVAAAGLLAVIGAFDFAGTIASGWLSDRFDNRALLSAYYGLRGLSLLYLPFSHFSMPALLLFTVFYGLDWVATVPPTVKLAAAHFGPQRSGLVFGWIFAGHQLGAATAALGAGTSRTLLGSYLPALVAAGSLCLAAALLSLSLPAGRKWQTAESR